MKRYLLQKLFSPQELLDAVFTEKEKMLIWNQIVDHQYHMSRLARKEKEAVQTDPTYDAYNAIRNAHWMPQWYNDAKIVTDGVLSKIRLTP